MTEQALQVGINVAQAGNTVGDIGHAIESFVRGRKENKYGIVEVLSGHGVGRAIHEDPYIPNFGKKGKGEKLIPGDGGGAGADDKSRHKKCNAR